MAPWVMRALITTAHALGSFSAYLALYGRDALGLSAVQAGRLLAVAQIGGAAGRLAWAS